MLRKLSTTTADFAEKFVEYVTGSKSVPYHDQSYKILVEFGTNGALANDDALPFVWTCVMTMLFPVSAYGADENMMQEKLKMAMIESANVFTGDAAGASGDEVDPTSN